METYHDGSQVAVCFTSADSFMSAFYFVASILVFFLLPFVILLLLYAAIAYKLLRRKTDFQRPTSPTSNELGRATTISQPQAQPVCRRLVQHRHQQTVHQHRRQVIGMLIAVVTSFFVCLLPFRALTLWIIVGTPEDVAALGLDGYYGLLFFCRIMLYLNSALNPILYTCMSSKFRNGFWRLMTGCCGSAEHRMHCTRTSTTRRELQTTVSGAKSTRILGRDGTFLLNSMSTSSGSGTDRTSWRSGGSLSTSLLNQLSDEQRLQNQLEATVVTTTCIYARAPQ